MNQAFCPKFISLAALDLTHRGQITMAARMAMIPILARNVLITSGLVHKKVVRVARIKRMIFEIKFKGLKKYPLSAPAKKMMPSTSPSTTVMISRAVPRMSNAGLNTNT